MKGGITSGIVYPPLVLKLKEHGYRFRCIGGTSAGAIAAAATAAAEYGRDTGGFEKLADLRRQLSEANFLRNLFQPTGATAPLMKVLLECKELLKQNNGKGFVRGFRLAPALTWVVMNRAPMAFLIGALIGVAFVCFIALACFFAFGGGTAHLAAPSRAVGVVMMCLIVLIAALLGGWAAAVTQFAGILTREIPRNKFGLCTGRKDSVSPEHAEVLTDWLHNQINDMAGPMLDGTPRHQPLTFGELRTKPLPEKDEPKVESSASPLHHVAEPPPNDAVPKTPPDENIKLRMVTSNLSQNQPYVLPFKGQLFIFKEADFRELFPADVVAYLIAAETPRPTKYMLPAGYHFLPDADDLPVIVATRMSLSFPVLLSAVPLYTIRSKYLVESNRSAEAGQSPSDITEKDIQVNWFSDGGICSNFPMHFFDSWLPTRPTFGVNLTSLPKEAFQPQNGDSPTPKDAETITAPKTIKLDYISPTSDGVVKSPNTTPVYLPQANECPVTELIPLHGKAEQPDLLKFIWAIFTTAQNYRDNAQSVLPSYRERIVQVRLSDDEGGLNLAMPDEVIEKVVSKGNLAGELLTKFEFDKHQWVRFRVLMKQLEENLGKMQNTIKGNAIYSDIMESNIDLAKYPYPYKSSNWMPTAIERLEAIGKAIQAWNNQNIFAGDPQAGDLPLIPEPVLRVTPEL